MWIKKIMWYIMTLSTDLLFNKIGSTLHFDCLIQIKCDVAGVSKDMPNLSYL